MIPKKDLPFVQKKAIKLLNEGKTIDEIRQLVANEGGSDEQMKLLPPKYLEDFVFLIKEVKKVNRKTASVYQTVGIVFLVSGLLLTAISYISMDGEGSVFFWSLLLIGLILIGRGIMLQSNSN